MLLENGGDMITFYEGSSPVGVLPPLDPVLAAEIDDTSLYDALRIAGLADQIVIVTELSQRGLPVWSSIGAHRRKSPPTPT